MSAKYTFTGFPPEIRNMIYTFSLSASEHTEPPFTRQLLTGNAIKRRDLAFSQGYYYPYPVHTVQTKPCPFSSPINETVRVLWHADPTIMLLNSQIRQEALSLFVAKGISVDVVPPQVILPEVAVNYVPLASLPVTRTENDGLYFFRTWMAKSLDAQVKECITRHKTNEDICIRRRDGRSQSVRDEGHSWATRMRPAFLIAIEEDGQALTLRTLYELEYLQKAMLQTLVNYLVTGPGRRDSDDKLNGLDILTMADMSSLARVPMVGTCNRLEQSSVKEEVIASRWSMCAEGKDLGCDKMCIRKWNFEHLAAKARLGG